MPQSAAPATQNDRTTCLETFKMLRLPRKLQLILWKRRKSIAPSTQNDFPHVTKKNTSEVPHLPRKTKWQPAWKPSKRRGFAASPTDTARPQENQRLETRHVGAAKRAFRARLPLILALCSFKIDVFLRVFLGTSKFATSKTMYRARLPSIFSISHKMPRLPRNLHLVCRRHLTQPCQCDSQKHATCCACYAKWQSAAPATKLQRRKSIAPATQNDFRHVTKHVWMSRRATPATRNEATPQAYETSKNDPFCRTYHRHGHMAMTRTVANGCGRLSNVEGTYPRNGNPCYAFGKKFLWSSLCKSFCVKRRLCVKMLCAKASLLKSLCVQKRLCVKTLCVEAPLCQNFSV